MSQASLIPPARLVIASRESALAMWQAEHIRDRLRALYPQTSVSILGMTTQGDQILNVTLSKIGGKGLFVKELETALDAARRYFEATGRRVSIEYALIRDMNDHAWRADLLAAKLNDRGRGWVHVNPIPLNPTPGSIWTASDPRVAAEFVAHLRAAGVPTTVRDTRGSDIDGACGQLAAAEEV